MKDSPDCELRVSRLKAILPADRFLVLSGSVPGDDGVGAILVRQILQELPREKLRVITFTPRGAQATKSGRSSWEDINLTRRYEPAFRPVPGPVGDLLSFVAHLALGRPYLQGLIRKSVEAGKGFDCQAVLAILDNPTVIRIAVKVARSLHVPLYCFVMDDPALHLKDFSLGPLLGGELIKSFNRAMHRSVRIAVAGESMKDSYKRRFGKQGNILRQGLEYQTPRSNVERLSKKDNIVRIGFAGSMTAKDAYDQLIAELDRRDWRLAGKPAILRIIGSFLKLVPSSAQHIEYFGWRPIPEMIDLCSECDLLYLPQSFSSDLKEFTALSFPNKLCTYLPSRRPILLHSPTYGSLNRFFRSHQCGPVSNCFEAGQLLEKAEELLADEMAYQQAVTAIEDAYRMELNRKRLSDEVADFLLTTSARSALSTGIPSVTGTESHG